MHYLLIYDVVADYTTARAPYRKSHLLHAMAAHQRGEILLAGALANPADGAVLVFQGDSPKAAEDFARADPYVINGVVTVLILSLAFTVFLIDLLYPLIDPRIRHSR